ncbi:TolC family protein [Acidipila sp. 4G-K13]|uniref:TolC family protein n=2 Tax=Paracidobacterium acidisoli TaxID=2303751 RepID=A0A372IM58_9BACT|nr:TolC family protein [Paracidobacterium acidisoli]
MGMGGACGHAQSAPASPAQIWHSSAAQDLSHEAASIPEAKYDIDPHKIWTLPELIDLAEQHNPETRVAWAQAKARAASLGIARSALFPTMAAVALAATVRTAALIGEYFHRQTEGLFQPTLHVEYLVLDFGGRSGAIDLAKANLLASDFAFNDTHRKIIFQVASAYYRLLNAKGQREAAEVSLKNAQTVEEDAQNRLSNGLATKPDLLEATAARAQADYDLQAAVGAEDIARGDLATVMGLPPATTFQVQDIHDLATPSDMAGSVDQDIDRAFAQRPDLMQQLTRIRAASASIKEARSTYFPTLSFAGDGGLARAYGQQDLYPGSYAQGEVWSVGMQLKWTLFDGLRREHQIAEAEAGKKEAQAGVEALRDQIADEVWTAYTNMKTALRQQQAAAALLTASEQSYEAARESYGYGVRNLLDVVSAQKTLAQARSEDIAARSQLLLQVAGLAFRTGDLIQVQPPKAGP